MHSTAATMDNTSSINTHTAAATGQHLSSFEDESIQDALTLHDLASLFDPAHHLDETVEFMDPQVAKQDMGLNTPQVPAVNCGFNPGFDDMMAWDEKTMADILSMEEEQQHVLQPSHITQPPALPNGANNEKSSITTKKRRHTTNSGGMKKKKKTECNNKENEPPASSSSTLAAAAATTPPGVPRTKSAWPHVNLFPSAHPQPVRRSFSDTGADTSVAVEGVEPQRRRKKAVATRTVSTSTEDEVSQCGAMGYPSFNNVRYEIKSKVNLYDSRAWKDVLSKTRSGVSYKSYLASGQIMLNTTVDNHTLELQGTWMNVRGGNDNNLPFKVPHIFEFLSMIVNLRSSTQCIDHLIGNTIRLLIEDGRIRLLRGVRSISIDIGTPEEFAQLQEGCIRALEVLLLLQSRHQQRKKLEAFLINNPLPCSCPSGGSDHVKHYYYSSAVSSLEDVLPLEWVFKAYA